MPQTTHATADRTQTHGYLYAFACVVVAGTSVTVGKLGVQGTDPITFAFWIFRLAAPIATAATAIVLVGTVPRVNEWIGGLLILGGCALVVWGANRQSTRNGRSETPSNLQSAI